MKMNPQQKVLAYKAVTGGVLAVGFALDLASLFWTMEQIGSVAFTATGEIILSIWFFAAFVLSLLARPHIEFRSLASSIFHGVITFYMLALTIMHGVNNLLFGNLAWYLKTFSGPVYPYAAGVVLLAMLVFTLSRRAKAPVVA
jgi:hypothetical protein